MHGFGLVLAVVLPSPSATLLLHVCGTMYLLYIVSGTCTTYVHMQHGIGGEKE